MRRLSLISCEGFGELGRDQMNLNDTFKHLKLSDLVPARTILKFWSQHHVPSVDSKALGILHSVLKIGCHGRRCQHTNLFVDIFT